LSLFQGGKRGGLVGAFRSLSVMAVSLLKRLASMGLVPAANVVALWTGR
jgi:hypothetical protein